MKKLLVFLSLALCLLLALPLVSNAAPDRGTAVFIYKPVDGATGEGDQAFMNFLVSAGFTVKGVPDEECTTANADGAALLAIGESVSSANVKEKFASVAAPIYCAEMAAWEDMGFGAQLASYDGDTYSVKLSGSHAIIAATANKNFDLFTEPQTTVCFDVSTAGAGGVVLASKDAENAYFIAYDKGSAMINGMTASSRRIASCIYGQTAAYLTRDAWAFIGAMIDWLSPPPVVEEVAVETAAAETAGTAEPAQPAAPAAVPTAPQTSDVSPFAVFAIVAGLGLVVLARENSKKRR